MVLSVPVWYICPFTMGRSGGRGVFFFFRCCASQGKCLLHTWYLSNMSGLWVLEERISAGEPILDLWEPKSGHFRSRPLHFTMGRSDKAGILLGVVVVETPPKEIG